MTTEEKRREIGSGREMKEYEMKMKGRRERRKRRERRERMRKEREERGKREVGGFVWPFLHKLHLVHNFLENYSKKMIFFSLLIN